MNSCCSFMKHISIQLYQLLCKLNISFSVHNLTHSPRERRIPLSPVNAPHKGQWRRTLLFSLICAWRLNKRPSKQSRRRWFDTPLYSSWCHCDVYNFSHISSPLTLEIKYKRNIQMTTWYSCLIYDSSAEIYGPYIYMFRWFLVLMDIKWVVCLCSCS